MKWIAKGFFLLIFSLYIPLSFAQDETTAPKLDCTLTDTKSEDTENVEAKNSFTTTTPVIYLICNSSDAKKDQELKAVWIADDTKNAAPPNYKIDEKSYKVPGDASDTAQLTADFSLSKPTKDWPVGSYHVDLFVDGQKNQSFKFTIQ